MSEKHLALEHCLDSPPFRKAAHLIRMFNENQDMLSEPPRREMSNCPRMSWQVHRWRSTPN